MLRIVQPRFIADVRLAARVVDDIDRVNIVPNARERLRRSAACVSPVYIEDGVRQGLPVLIPNKRSARRPRSSSR